MTHQFISYTPTPGEKYIGVSAITTTVKARVLYKIIPTKDGSSFYPVTTSVKIGDSYSSAFVVDSNIEKEEIENIIKQGVKKALSQPQQKPIASSASVSENLEGMPF